MTAREPVVRRARLVIRLMLFGWLAALMVGVFTQPVARAFGLAVPPDLTAALLAPAILVFMGSGLYLHYGLRCPLCRGNLSPLVAHLGDMSFPFNWSSRRVQYCPYCGIDLDAEVATAEGERSLSDSSLG